MHLRPIRPDLTKPGRPDWLLFKLDIFTDMKADMRCPALTTLIFVKRTNCSYYVSAESGPSSCVDS